MEKQDEKKLAGCIILYHPDDDVIKNISSYIDQIHVLYVVDNTETVSLQLKNKLSALSEKIIYLPQYKNIGIAAALNFAAGMACKNGYRSMLTMDQDSSFLGDEFFCLYKGLASDKKENIGLLAASYTADYDRWQKPFNSNFNEIHYAVTSGNIVDLNAWIKVGRFEEKLFIDEVDHEYCLKLRKAGYKILISKSILMKHVIGEFYSMEEEDLIKKTELKIHHPSRYYYMSRNVLYLCKKYFFDDLRFVFKRIYYLVKVLGKIIILYPDKRNYLRPFFKGVTHFFQSKYNQFE